MVDTEDMNWLVFYLSWLLVVFGLVKKIYSEERKREDELTVPF